MLGNILNGLTNADAAEDALASICASDIMEQIRRDAAAEGVATGAFVAARLRHMLEHAGEDVWLDLLGRMSGTPQPGVTALGAMLARAFPDAAAPHIARRPS